MSLGISTKVIAKSRFTLGLDQRSDLIIKARINGKIGMVQVRFILLLRPMPFFIDEKSNWNPA